MTDAWTAAPGGDPAPAGSDLHGSVRPGAHLHRVLAVRPPLTLVGVLAAVAGALIAVAIITVLGISDDPSPWLLVVLALVVVLGGWSIGMALTALTDWERRPGRLAELIPLGSVMAAVGAPALVAGIVATQTVDATDTPSTSLVWWPTAVVALVLLALWLAPGLQGRPVLMASGLLMATWSLAGLIAVQVGTDSSDRRISTYDEGPYFANPFAGFADLAGSIGDAYRAASIVAFAAGVAFLLIAAIVDRVGLPGLGTPLIVAGVIAGGIGAQGVVTDQAVLQALVPLLLVVLVVAVGVLGGRKATTWLGAVLSVGLIIQLALALLGDDPSAGVAAALIGLFGLLVLLGAVALATTRPRHTDDPTSAPPIPTPPVPAPGTPTPTPATPASPAAAPTTEGYPAEPPPRSLP
jgi:hypothetical protein